MAQSAEAEGFFRRASRRYLVSALAGVTFFPLTLGFSTWPWPTSRLVLWAVCVAAGAAIGHAPLRRLNQTHGSRHALQAYVLAWTLFLIVPVLVDVLALPETVLYVTAAFMGAGLSAIATSHVALRNHLGAPPEPARTILAVDVVLLILLVSYFVFQSMAIGYGVLAINMATSVRALGRVPDPNHPQTSPFGPYLPWRLADGTRTPIGNRWWTRFPAHLLYSFGTVALFGLWVIVFERDRTRVPQSLTWTLVYEIPNLFADLPRTVVNFATGVWFNHHPVQVIYVFALLGLFGIWFEIHEGSRRAVAVFYGSSIFAGITAGLLLHVIRAMFHAAWIDDAWTHAWNGGSAGAFGLAGGYAARAQRPWLLLAALLFWEINVELWHLRSYTVAFHVIALAFGYACVRYAMPPRAVTTGSMDAVPA